MEKSITPYLSLYSADSCRRGWRTNLEDLPDECLTNVFEFLDSIDRKNCSLVCHRWFRIDGQSRLHLGVEFLYHESDLLFHPDIPFLDIPSLLTRFDSLTSLAFQFVRIDDDDLVLISLRCRKLTRLKLRCCRLLTDAGVAEFALNCKGLKEFDAQYCVFGAKGINAILNNSSFLEHLTALNLDGFAVTNTMSSSIGPGVAASSLKTICIGERPSQFFVPLIIASKNLTTLKVYNCSGNWDKVFETMVKQQVTGLVEIQLTRVGISDAALVSISNFLDLETLRLAANVNCTNGGLAYIANGCKRLRKLHIKNSSRFDKIRDEGITAIAKGCPKLEELILVRVNITSLSLNMFAQNCPKLNRLELWKNDTVHNAEMRLIAAKFMALKYLIINDCGITDQGVLALSSGCPNLLHLDIINCIATTPDGLNQLKSERDSLVVNNRPRSFLGSLFR